MIDWRLLDTYESVEIIKGDNLMANRVNFWDKSLELTATHVVETFREKVDTLQIVISDDCQFWNYRSELHISFLWVALFELIGEFWNNGEGWASSQHNRKCVSCRRLLLLSFNGSLDHHIIDSEGPSISFSEHFLILGQ